MISFLEESLMHLLPAHLLIAMKGVLINFLYFSVAYALLIGLGIAVLAVAAFTLGTVIS